MQGDGVAIIPRLEIKCVNTVEVDGQLFSLGEHRDFRNHPKLKAFLPDSGRVSLSWTRLNRSQRLEVHTHPKASMVVVSKGRATVIGDVEADLIEGDIVLIPAHRQHGFVASPDSAFEALSIQFEGNGLYENAPLVRIEANLGIDLPAFNKKRLEEHAKTRFFQLLSSKDLKNPAKRQAFDRCLKLWSTNFQKILHARATFTRNREYDTIFRQHFREELDHDLLLSADITDFFDPIIESCSEWYIRQMISSSDAERLVIVHYVLEASAHEFYERTLQLRKSSAGVDEQYFAVHHHLDAGHAQVGEHLLRCLTFAEQEESMRTAIRAWDVLDAMFASIARRIDGIAP